MEVPALPPEAPPPLYSSGDGVAQALGDLSSKYSVLALGYTTAFPGYNGPQGKAFFSMASSKGQLERSPIPEGDYFTNDGGPRRRDVVMGYALRGGR